MGGQQACHEQVGVHHGHKLLLVLAALPYHRPPLACPTEALTSPLSSGDRGTRLWDLTGTEAPVQGQDQRQPLPGGVRVWTGEGSHRGHEKEEQLADSTSRAVSSWCVDVGQG